MAITMSRLPTARPPGGAELHETQNDVFFILSGEATLIQGGALVDPKLTEPHEYEAKSIKGGTRTKLVDWRCRTHSVQGAAPACSRKGQADYLLRREDQRSIAADDRTR